MWSYFGSKTNVVKFYPAPKHGKIIEPFAGTARYSLKYFDRDVVLVDKYEVVVRIWQWLQKCSIGDIQKLPHKIEPGQSLDDFTFDCIEAKNLLGFLVGFGLAAPRKTGTVFRMTSRPNHVNYSLSQIAKNLFKIRHWKIIHGSYSDIENQEATWFVDAPYQFGGHCYIESNKNIDFPALGSWCMERKGQVIVCENTQAKWMNFIPITTHQGAHGMQKEAVWCNSPISYQLELLRQPTQRAADSAPPYTAEELDIITDPRRNGALQDPPSR
jgi:hypothetical protein